METKLNTREGTAEGLIALAAVQSEKSVSDFLLAVAVAVREHFPPLASEEIETYQNHTRKLIEEVFAAKD